MEAKNNISKSITFLLLTFQVCFGFDFGFLNALNKKIRPPLKLCSLIMTVFISVVIVRPINTINLHILLYSLYSVNLIASFIVLKVSKYTVYDFLFHIQRIGGNKNDQFGIIITISTFVSVLVNIILCIIKCNMIPPCFDSVFGDTLTVVFSSTKDIISTVQFIVYYSIFEHVKSLKSMLYDQLNIKKGLKLYISILEIFDFIKPLIDNLVVLQFLCGTPIIMCTLLNVLIYQKSIQEHNSVELYAFFSEIFFACCVLIQIIAPAVVVEMVKSQLDDAKVILHDHLILEQDETEQNEIIRFLRFMEARTLGQHKVWRLLPVDLRLPLAMLSICTTYLIVIIQFTHLYD